MSSRSRIRWAVFLRTLARSNGVNFIQLTIALPADSMARLTSARLPKAISMMTSSVAGLMMPTVLPSWAAHHWPSMYIFLVVAVAVAVAMRSSWRKTKVGGYCKVLKSDDERAAPVCSSTWLATLRRSVWATTLLRSVANRQPAGQGSRQFIHKFTSRPNDVEAGVACLLQGGGIDMRAVADEKWFWFQRGQFTRQL